MSSFPDIHWAFGGGTGGAVVIFAAALFRGFTGFGFALSAVPLLSLFVSPRQAVPVAVGLQSLGGLVELKRNVSAIGLGAISLIGAIKGLLELLN